MKIELPLTQDIIDSFKDSLKSTSIPSRKIRPCRIKFMGEFITLENGKNLWKRIGDAKLALNNHLETSLDFANALINRGILNEPNLYRRRYILREINTKKLRESLEAAGLIEYVEVDF